MSKHPRTDAVAFKQEHRGINNVWEVECVYADFARRLEEENDRLAEALRAMMAHAVVLSDSYLDVFKDWGDDATIQGWDKARWVRASAAYKQGEVALAQRDKEE